MEINVDRTKLAHEFKLLKGISERNATIPVLPYALFSSTVDSSQTYLTISCTDLEVALKTNCEADIITGGYMLVPVKEMNELLGLITSPEINIKRKDDSTITVKSGKFKSDVKVPDIKDYPCLSWDDALVKHSIPVDIFRDMISKTRFVGSSEDVRFLLSGALLEIVESGYNLVATDGYRMGIAATSTVGEKGISPLPDEGTKEKSIITHKGLSVIQNLLAQEDAGGQVEFWFTEKNNYFAIGDRLISVRKLATAFPAYRKVIPETTNIAKFNRLELRMAIKRVMVLCKGESRLVSLDIQGDECNLSGSASQAADSTETIDVDYSNENGFQISYVARFLLDYLNVVESEEIHLCHEKTGNAVLHTASDELCDYKYVIIPAKK